jgi:hypothetical protein
MMMMDRNNVQIARRIMRWIEAHVGLAQGERGA